ncbi:unnamed protein product, partial [Closterium sp. NIES-53]
FDAILAAMYALADSAEGDCYLSVPPDPGIAAAALGASAAAALGASASAAPGTGASAAPRAGASPLSGTAPTESLHTFTLDSGASRSFFRDSTTLTPLSRPVAVALADPSGGPVLAHSSKVLPCPAAPSGLLSGFHLPSFSTNLVSGADLQDAWVAASSQVIAAASRSSPVSAPCSCRPLSHETFLWQHRLGHPSLPRLRGMASRALVSGLPRSLPPLPPGPAPTCVPCVEGRQRAAPHSSSFPPTEAPLQTLHMDVWGPACVRGQGHERYFLLLLALALGPTRGLTERREPESRPVSPESRFASPVQPVCTSRVSRPRPPPVPGTHSMTLRPSTAPQRVPLLSPPASDSLRAACPAVTRFLATAVTHPLFESSAASALVAELVDIAAACRLDYATSLVAESASASVCPPSVG